MKTDFDKLIAKLMEDNYYENLQTYWELCCKLENAIAAQLFRFCKAAKMNMISFAKPFFCLRAMTGKRGSRS